MCLTPSDPMDCRLPGYSVHGILQARILEWVTISFSRGSSRPRDQTRVSCIGGRCFNFWATREAPGHLRQVHKGKHTQPAFRGQEQELQRTSRACQRSRQETRRGCLWSWVKRLRKQVSFALTKAAEKSAKESPADVPGWDPVELSWDRPLPSLSAVALLWNTQIIVSCVYLLGFSDAAPSIWTKHLSSAFPESSMSLFVKICELTVFPRSVQCLLVMPSISQKADLFLFYCESRDCVICGTQPSYQWPPLLHFDVSEHLETNISKTKLLITPAGVFSKGPLSQ